MGCEEEKGLGLLVDRGSGMVGCEQDEEKKFYWIKKKIKIALLFYSLYFLTF